MGAALLEQLIVVLLRRSISSMQSWVERPVAHAPALTAAQKLTMTCTQAWAATHKTYPEMLAIVTTLAKVSPANRNLRFPNTRETGVNAGKGIAEDCKADPNALLFAVVDTHVRRVAEAKGPLQTL